MSFGREKRLLLGWMAALAPLPLPFNAVVEWSFILAYWMALAVFLYRANQGSEDWLPNWALNLIGLIYMPVVYLDFTRFWGGQILRPLLHLAAFALVVKLFALQREKEKWHVLIGIFFLFLASMGTSVHPSIVFYLLLFLTLSIVCLTRFATFHYLESFQQSSVAIEDASLRRFMIVSLSLTVLVAVLLFPVLPRVGTPYIVAGGGGGERRSPASGFSDVMTLEGIGRIRTNNEVAMRLQYEAPPPIGHEMRYKGATYEIFEGLGWKRSPRVGTHLERNGFGLFPLQDGAPLTWVDFWVEPLGVRSLFIPTGSMALDIKGAVVAMDEGGALSVRQRQLSGAEYRIALGAGAVSAAVPPAEETGALDQGGVTDRIGELAAQVMGEGSQQDRVQRLERHLTQQYGYTLDLMGRGGSNPIESFLFEDRRGHCELFASSMVLMLRSQGIPARLVTGFLGAEPSPLEDYFIVRQSNAHAWVEAYVEGVGWRIYEPTPPSGRPMAGEGGVWSIALRAYDYVLFRWDRYILTFGASDQISLLGGLRNLWSDLRGALFGDQEGAASMSSERDRAGVSLEQTGGVTDHWAPSAAWWGVLLIVALVVLWWGWRNSPEFNATRAYRLLRRRARRRGLEIPDSMGPAAVGEALMDAWPAAAGSFEPIVETYLAESFGGQELSEQQVAQLRVRLREATESMRVRSEEAASATSGATEAESDRKVA